MLHTRFFVIITCPGCPSNLVCDSNGANCVCKEGFTKESECCDCDKDHYLKVSEEGTIVKRECKSKLKSIGIHVHFMTKVRSDVINVLRDPSFSLSR